jgi:hypothetical protein
MSWDVGTWNVASDHIEPDPFGEIWLRQLSWSIMQTEANPKNDMGAPACEVGILRTSCVRAGRSLEVRNMVEHGNRDNERR